ncbi:MAG: xanthine dehydrogenase family protein molybdopterin-binding subunit [Rhodospirillales bacterium]|nr:xanthine dehydrogenase family protein molybdopterin-binding subunit [Rhodospirillales bacterium]
MGIVSVGQSVPRHEDPYLLRGKGAYTADRSLPNQAYGVVLRSPHAFARINGIDTAAALAAPGVLCVLTGKDLEEEGIGALPIVAPPIPGIDQDAMIKHARYPIATDTARMVGHEVAFVVAETLAQAKDAAELVEVDYEPLEALTSSFQVASGPPRYDDAPDNLAFDSSFGDKDATDAAFAKADHAVKLTLTVNRVAPATIENRASLVDYDPAGAGGKGRWTIYVPVQGPFGLKNTMANLIFKCDPDQFHVVTGNVGGSFGMKALYPETVLAAVAARRLGRPVKWENERAESLLTDQAGRDKVVDAELALDKDGKFLGLRIHSVQNLGAFFGTMGVMHTHLSLVGMINVYRTPAIHHTIRGGYSNTCFTGPYRGSNRPDSTFIMERLLDYAAAELGMDRIELRRRNMIQPDQLPYTMPLGTVYDSGDFPDNLEKALAAIDYEGFEARREEAKSRGKLLGLGVGNNIEQAAGVGQEFATYRLDADGSLTIIAGTTELGQGHPTMYRILASDQLGIDTDDITVIEGDTDAQAAGNGTGGSRVSVMGTHAALAAGAGLIERGKEVAGGILEAAAADIEFSGGFFRVAGTDKQVSLADVARTAHENPPADEDGGRGPGLEYYAQYDGKAATYPNGCHVCEVEVDPETGAAKMTRYAAVNDVGTVINPLTVEGQILGGIGQGAGQALLEGIEYDGDTGQMLTGSFLDYAMPRGIDFCDIQFISNPRPTGNNRIGAKGVGEVGCACAMPATANAVIHALEPHGVKHLDMPLTPGKVWDAIRRSGEG